MANPFSNNYSLSKFMGTVTTSSEQQSTILLDIMDPNIYVLLRNLKDKTTYRVAENEPITTICYKFYGTTTPWWMVLMYNGLYHPMDISAGINLRIPDIVAITSIASTLNPKKSRIGTIITV